MTTTERNEVLSYVLARLWGAINGCDYRLDNMILYEDHVMLSLFRSAYRSGWDDDYSSVTFTFDELCDPAFAPELSVVCRERFEEAIREEARLKHEAEQRRLAEEAADAAARKAKPKLTKEQRDRAELARLKALYET